MLAFLQSALMSVVGLGVARGRPAVGPALCHRPACLSVDRRGGPEGAGWYPPAGPTSSSQEASCPHREGL